MTQAWIIRAGRGDRYEKVAFGDNVVAIGWPATGDLTPHTTLTAVRDVVWAAYPRVEAKSAESYAVQLLAFRSRICEGDLVLLLRQTSPDVAIGWVTGPYRYRADLGAGIHHTRAVHWSRVDLPRALVARELGNLPPLTTVVQIASVDIIDRLRQMTGDAVTLPSTEDVDTTGVGIPAGANELETPQAPTPFSNLQRNLNYARNLATAGQHLAQLQVGAFEVPDVFRAAWVQSVAALDHWVRQELRSRMLLLASQPGGARPAGFTSFPMSLGLMEAVRAGDLTLVEAIDRQLRETRSHLTYQHPDKIREALALVSDVKGLWDRVATVLSERAGDGVVFSGSGVRQQLREIVIRRNKIAHESDEDPANPESKRSIDAASATQTIDWIEQLAAAILVVLDQD